MKIEIFDALNSVTGVTQWPCLDRAILPSAHKPGKESRMYGVLNEVYL
jgi:hypothetical protein